MPTLSCPPQGKLPNLLSSKPRALGEMSWKWQETKGARKMRARKLADFVMLLFFGGREGGGAFLLVEEKGGIDWGKVRNLLECQEI